MKDAKQKLSREGLAGLSQSELIELILTQQEQLKTLQQQVTDLNNRLTKYENPHTPPSKRFGKRKAKKSKKKRGGLFGHKGATRPVADPDETIEAHAKSCPDCGGDDYEFTHTEERIIEEFIPSRVKATRFLIPHFSCNCGCHFQGVHEQLPQIGRFGIHVLVKVTALKYQLRGVLRKIAEYLCYHDQLNLTHKSIANLLSRVAGVCKGQYDQILIRLRGSPFVYMDETSMRVLGRNWWLWIFRTTRDILVVIRPSRGQGVLKEIFGDHPLPTGVCDGWKPYRLFPDIQRCWAHLLRIVDEAAEESLFAREFAQRIYECFQYLKINLKKELTPAEQWAHRHYLDDYLKNIVEQYKDVKELKKPIRYIENGAGHWFTCLTFQGMQPTNNLAEQAIREHVIVRRIIGAFRSEKGAEEYQYIASILASWKLQNKNIFQELEKNLRENLCLKLA